MIASLNCARKGKGGGESKGSRHLNAALCGSQLIAKRKLQYPSSGCVGYGVDKRRKGGKGTRLFHLKNKCVPFSLKWSIDNGIQRTFRVVQDRYRITDEVTFRTHAGPQRVFSIFRIVKPENRKVRTFTSFKLDINRLGANAVSFQIVRRYRNRCSGYQQTEPNQTESIGCRFWRQRVGSKTE